MTPANVTVARSISEFPKYWDSCELHKADTVFLTTDISQQPSAIHPGGNYTHRQIGQPQSAHALKVAEVLIRFVHPINKMWIMWHMRFQMQRLDILLAIPEGATGLTSVVNATSNGQFSRQYIPSPVTSGPTANETRGIRYKVWTNPKKVFKVRRVRLCLPSYNLASIIPLDIQAFAVVWYEDMGNAAPLRGDTKSLASDHELMTVGNFGSKIYTDIRRTVVFDEIDQYAWCFAL
ncbi:hypothetical protein BDV40DRAFT_299117 [Aspergillus tamarii]|uniref:Uncharacterized protein n=1 Tax=Aspergillus tamarii TaxID=41984 RepID=A0A5N6UZ67_ASPTM|nr:hypothetical protein BDV40DRAFT_299117 [Aspergillus tamarii]